MKFLGYLLFCFLVIHSKWSGAQSNFENQLYSIPEIDSVQKFSNHPYFQESYILYFNQLLNHEKPSNGKFQQRIFISLNDTIKPIVYVTEGYEANYAKKSSYINELVEIIGANQVVVEHRYFGESFPDSLNWDYLTIKNATADLHRIYNSLQAIFKNNKWIATGISKGGQNTIAYSAFYPNDMDFSIPYVGPINFAVEDERIETFLEEVSSRRNRNKIHRFQRNVLKNRKTIQPLLDSLIKANEYTFSISNAEVLDYTVLEYSFSFWQWGYNVNSIPKRTVTANTIFKHLTDISNPEYFSKSGVDPISSFFVQSLKEFGYYGYSVKPFRRFLIVEDASNYIEKVFLDNKHQYEFDQSTSNFIIEELSKSQPKMLLIYGENDPWTAAAYKPNYPNSRIFIKKNGSHRTRINNLPPDQKSDVINQINKWMNE